VPKASKNQSLGETYRQLGPYMGLGTELAASVAGMLLLGYYLDQRLNTSPWLLLTGAVIGMVGGFYNFIREVQKLGKLDTKRENDLLLRSMRKRTIRTSAVLILAFGVVSALVILKYGSAHFGAAYFLGALLGVINGAFVFLR